MKARRVIDGAILDGKITFWTVNFTKSQKQPHTDNTGNEWDLSLARCLAAAGSPGGLGGPPYRRRREGWGAAFVFLLLYCNMCDRLLHQSPPQSSRARALQIVSLMSNFSGLIPCCLVLTSLPPPPPLQ